MARVYFHLVRQVEMIRDGEGMDTADVDRTVLEVIKTLKELQLADPAQQASWDGWTVHITDENGIEVATIPLSTTSR
jgi:hypothetical protein